MYCNILTYEISKFYHISEDIITGQKRRAIRSYAIIITVGIILIISVGLILWFKIPTTQVTSLMDLSWEQDPNLLAVGDAERLDHKGLLFLRLLDSKEQFFVGDWQVNFSQSGAYAFGEFPEEEGQKMYFISNETVHEIKLAGFSGKVTAIREDPTAAYIFIEITNENSTVYCIAKDILGETPNCQQLDINKRSTARWNPNKELELALRTDAGKMYSYDPLNDKMDFLDPDEDAEHHRELVSLFEPPETEQNRYWHFSNTILVKNSAGWNWHRIPNEPKRIAWLNDSDHLLIIEQDRISVLELTTNKLAPILEETDIGNHQVFTELFL